MSLPKPTIVIFDMDGTSVRHLDPKMLGLMEFLDDTAFKVSKFWEWLVKKHAHGPIIGESDLADPERPVRKAKSIIVHEAIHKFRKKPVELLVEPCPGIYGVLNLLKSKNIPMALVSNGLGKGYGADIVEKFGFDEYFKICVFREDIHKSKPHPESLLLALNKMEVKVTKDDVIWYIGDRHKDVTAARAADGALPCTVVPVAYAINAAMAAIKQGLGPSHILMSYRDIYEQLHQLLKN